ncbi:unnamed protein product [Dicrocoelium dendriticum]|nr:unnamed protein product [Dicrocoelium dendriticum]
MTPRPNPASLRARPRKRTRYFPPPVALSCRRVGARGGSRRNRPPRIPVGPRRRPPGATQASLRVEPRGPMSGTRPAWQYAGSARRAPPIDAPWGALAGLGEAPCPPPTGDDGPPPLTGRSPPAGETPPPRAAGNGPDAPPDRPRYEAGSERHAGRPANGRAPRTGTASPRRRPRTNALLPAMASASESPGAPGTAGALPPAEMPVGRVISPSITGAERAMAEKAPPGRGGDPRGATAEGAAAPGRPRLVGRRVSRTTPSERTPGIIESEPEPAGPPGGGDRPAGRSTDVIPRHGRNPAPPARSGTGPSRDDSPALRRPGDRPALCGPGM